MIISYFVADFDGPGYHRMQLPCKYLSKVEGIYANIVTLEILQEFYSDIVILQRQCEPILLDIIKEKQKEGVKFVYELDDNLFNIPKENPGYSFWVEYNNVERALEIIKACDACIVSTNPLKNIIQHYTNNEIPIFVIPNYIEEPEEELIFDHDEIRIGWFGSDSHVIDFTEQITNAILAIRKKYDNVKFIFVGYIPDVLKGFVNFLYAVEPKYYLGFLRSLQLDIGIIPAINCKFNLCKSNIKFLEYSINQTATIASNIFPYKNSILPELGIVVDNTFIDWFEALTLLIEEEKLRKQLAINSYYHVKENFLWSNNYSFLIETYKNILKLKGKNG